MVCLDEVVFIGCVLVRRCICGGIIVGGFIIVCFVWLEVFIFVDFRVCVEVGMVYVGVRVVEVVCSVGIVCVVGRQLGYVAGV